MKHIFGLAALLLLFTGCDSTRKRDLDRLRQLKLGYYEQKGTFRDAIALDSAYRQFITRYPKDTLRPVMLYEAGVLNMKELENTRDAAQFLRRVVDESPTHRFADDALFHLAMLYDVMLQRPEMARQLYQEYLDKYPQGDYAELVQQQMMLYDLDLDDIVPNAEGTPVLP